jgi:hypothetical protein
MCIFDLEGRGQTGTRSDGKKEKARELEESVELTNCFLDYGSGFEILIDSGKIRHCNSLSSGTLSIVIV